MFLENCWYVAALAHFRRTFAALVAQQAAATTAARKVNQLEIA